MANNTKMNISYTIRAVDKFSATHAKLEKQLASLNNMTSGLSEKKTIDVDADTAGANAQLTFTKMLLDSIPGRKVITASWRGFNEGLDKADQLATKLRTLEELSQGFARGIVTSMIPSFGVALGIAAGGAGALVTALIGASAAVGAFSLVAVPTINYLAELDAEVERGSEAWNQLSEATRSTLTALDTLRASFAKLQERFREPTLEIFTIALQSANTMLGLFTPTVEASVGAVRRLAEAFQANLASGDVQAFFTWLGTTAGTYLESLGSAIGNFIMGFANMVVAFDPLAQSFAQGLLNMSERFREWAATLENNQAFQNFISYVQENGPTLLSFLGSTITFLVDLGVAMAPIGMKVMEIVTAFLQWSSALLENHTWLGQLIAILFIVKGAFGLLAPVISLVVVAFNTIWPVLSVVISWFSRLSGSFSQIIPKIIQVGATVMRLGTPFGWLITTVAVLASIVISHWDQIVAATQSAFSKIASWIKQKWNEVKTAFQILQFLASFLKQKFTEMVSDVVAKMAEIYTNIQQKWEQAKAIAQAVLSAMASVIRSKFAEMLSAIISKMAEIYNNIRSKWNEVKSFLSSIDLFSIGANIIRGLINGLKSIDPMGAVRSIAGKIKSGFQSLLGIHSPSRVMRDDVGRWITLGIVEGMANKESEAVREAKRIAEAITRPFHRAESDFQFTAGVATARGDYEEARATRYSTFTGEAVTASDKSAAREPQYAVINIGGHEARGTIEYITREQEREKARDKRFK